jgi:hypothetical protein
LTHASWNAIHAEKKFFFSRGEKIRRKKRAECFHLSPSPHEQMNTQKMEDAADIVISCGCEGCEEAVSTVCKGCGIATYCSAMHALEDWKNHAAECAYCVSSIAGASHWAVEMEVGQAAGSAQEKWVPSELVHARMDTSGLRVESTITNSQLVGDQANFSSNNGLFATTTLSVPRGKISRSSDLVTFRVLAATRTYEKVADFEYKLPAKSASRGVPGGRGMAFVLSESVIKAKKRREILCSLSHSCIRRASRAVPRRS